MSGPPRPVCRRHGKSDHDLCRGASRENFGEEFHEAYFGDPDRPYTRYTSIRPEGRMDEAAARLVERDPSEGVPK